MDHIAGRFILCLDSGVLACSNPALLAIAHMPHDRNMGAADWEPPSLQATGTGPARAAAPGHASRAAHQGRVRTFPHVEGLYPTTVMIPGVPPNSPFDAGPLRAPRSCLFIGLPTTSSTVAPSTPSHLTCSRAEQSTVCSAGPTAGFPAAAGAGAQTHGDPTSLCRGPCGGGCSCSTCSSRFLLHTRPAAGEHRRGRS